VPLARLRNSPLDLHASEPSRSDHASINRALGNELLASGRQDGQDVCGSLMFQLAMIPQHEVSISSLTFALMVRVVGFGLSTVSHAW
jgi:hypothetical protein